LRNISKIGICGNKERNKNKIISMIRKYEETLKDESNLR
jgi:hypothetical protein